MNAKEIATEILCQLGGNRFIAMTGARQFSYFDDKGECGICFRLPTRFAMNGINYVKIKLTWADTYEVTFFKVTGINIKTVVTHDNIYFDGLQDIFTQETGLNTRL